MTTGLQRSAMPVRKRRGRAGHRPGSAVDRYLCSQVRLSPRFADWVVGELVHPSLRAICPSYGIDLVALARHAVAARRRTRLLDLLLVGLFGLLVLGLVLVATGAGTGRGPVAVGLALVVVAICGPYVLVAVDELDTCRRATEIFDGTAALRDLAPALDPGLEAELERVDARNVVTFAGGVPFVGSGNHLGAWKLSVDLTKAATDPTGRQRTVRPFDVSDLHRELTLAVRRSGVPGLEVHNRLHVAGSAAVRVPGLLPDPHHRPRPVVDRDFVRLGIVKPRPEARTYLCMEHSSWGGELVVSAFVRAEIVSGHLFVEYHAYVLLPLREELCSGDLLPQTPWDVTRSVLRGVRTAGWRMLVGSPKRLHRHALAAQAARRRFAVEREQVRRRRGGDYGARVSIREVVGDTRRVHLYAYADEELYLGLMQRRVLSCLFTFLDGHGIDTSELVRQQQVISTTTYQIGSLTANNSAFGSQNTVVNQAPGGSAPAPAAPAQAPQTPPAPPWAGP